MNHMPEALPARSTTPAEQARPAAEPVRPAAEPPQRYDFAAAEPRWQAAWDAAQCFSVPDVPPADARKYYVLEMFPYPCKSAWRGEKLGRSEPKRDKS